MTDILERLRNLQEIADDHVERELYQIAADEIEQLHRSIEIYLAEITQLRAEIEQLRTALLRAMCLPYCGQHGTADRGKNCEHCEKRFQLALEHHR